MKNDDSCCQGGSNKNFKGSSCGCKEESSGCGCMEEVEMPTNKTAKVKGKMAMKKESSGCCGSH